MLHGTGGRYNSKMKPCPLAALGILQTHTILRGVSVDGMNQMDSNWYKMINGQKKTRKRAGIKMNRIGTIDGK